MNQYTTEQLDRLQATLADRRIPDHVQEDIRDDIRDAREELRRRARPGALSRHLAEYIRSQAHAESRGDRERPLCTCSDTLCSLKRGELPTELRHREDTIFDDEQDPHRRVTRYLERHDGGEVVEEALHDWERSGAEISDQIQQAVIRARKAVTQHTDTDIDPDGVPA